MCYLPTYPPNSRVLRSCVELAEKNPIVSIHDQGAGGNGNVLKEIVEPFGANYDLRKIPLGDQTLSALEIWGAEYQENDCFLTTKEDLPLVLEFAKRENCVIAAVGEVSFTSTFSMLSFSCNPSIS